MKTAVIVLSEAEVVDALRQTNTSSCRLLRLLSMSTDIQQQQQQQQHH